MKRLALFLLGALLALNVVAAPKNTVAKNWIVVTCFDTLYHSDFLAGNCPSGLQPLPTLLYTDVIDGPTSGGEGGNGGYLSAYGYSFGKQADLGTAAGARVYLRNHSGPGAWQEVANYRALVKSRIYATHQVMQVMVQIGSLGSMAAGTVLDLKVTVNGVDTNILASAFTVQPGRMWFVDNAAGSDATGKPDDITKPFRYLQNSTGGAQPFLGLWAATTPQGDAGLAAGDTIVIRGGTTYTDQTGYDGRWARFRLHTGTAPNGTSGNGYIKITRYPGPKKCDAGSCSSVDISGNAPETVRYDGVSGTSKGGIMGVNSAFYGTYGQYVAVSGLVISIPASTATADAAPIHMQYGGNFWRIVDNEATWPSSTSFNAGANCSKAAAIAGHGQSFKILGNHIHDVDCNRTTAELFTNHGIYIDSNDNTDKADNDEIAYNRIEDIPGGSSIQFQDTQTTVGTTNHSIHHNWMKNPAKYVLNLNAGWKSGSVWNNVVIGPTNSPYGYIPCIWMSNGSANMSNWQAGGTTDIAHNLVLCNPQSGGSVPQRYAISSDEGNITTGAVRVWHNTIVLYSSHTASGFIYKDATSTALVYKENLYYDQKGTYVAAPSDDATYGIVGNPLFTNSAAGNYTSAAGGPALGACTQAEALAVNDDFYGLARPVPGTGAPGGTKNDIGAFQGVGK